MDKGGYHVDGLRADFEASWHVDKNNPVAPPADKFTGMFFEENGRMFLAHRGQAVIVRPATDPKKPSIEVISSLGDPTELEAVIHRNDWNDYTLIANGNQFVHIINGRVMSLAIDDDRERCPKSGILAWQLHAGKPMRIEVKDVRIREIR